MKIIIRVLTFSTVILFLSACFDKRQRPEKVAITNDIVKDVHDILFDNEVLADIMDSIKVDPKAEEIYKKFQLGMQANQEWFLEEARKLNPGEQMKYDARFGVTEDEYKYILDSQKNIALLSTGKESIKFIEEPDEFGFISQGKLQIFNQIKIDLKNNVVIIGNETLKYKGVSDITDANNAFQSKWKAHSWQLTEPSDSTLEKTADLTHMTGKRYTFHIGVLEKTKKRFMKVKGTVLENGRKTLDFEIPIEF
jgi:hypothetical protein